MQSHPYDTFFDESILSKTGFDLYNFQKEVENSRRILQKCLDTGSHRYAPNHLSAELFKFAKFADNLPPQNSENQKPVVQVPDLENYKIDKKSV
mmetsp:Transcript_47212/g.62508  ORF Transcript_47212/g.62508 Transcript_47212/m.62508 type:complete len:94 (-) Transcript_47212:147-428(-)